MHELKIHKQSDKQQYRKCLPSAHAQSPIAGASHWIDDTMSIQPPDSFMGSLIAGPSHVQSIEYACRS